MPETWQSLESTPTSNWCLRVPWVFCPKSSPRMWSHRVPDLLVQATTCAGYIGARSLRPLRPLRPLRSFAHSPAFELILFVLVCRRMPPVADDCMLLLILLLAANVATKCQVCLRQQVSAFDSHHSCGNLASHQYQQSNGALPRAITPAPKSTKPVPRSEISMPQSPRRHDVARINSCLASASHINFHRKRCFVYSLEREYVPWWCYSHSC